MWYAVYVCKWMYVCSVIGCVGIIKCENDSNWVLNIFIYNKAQ